MNDGGRPGSLTATRSEAWLNPPDASARAGGDNPTVRETLAAAGRVIQRRDADILLAHVLGAGRTALYAHPLRRLTYEAVAAFAELTARRHTGYPVAYLLGRREFWSLDLEVTPDTLIPRAETEHLVEHALDAVAATGAERPRVADLGTGSGAVALAIATELPGAEVTATDISPDALAVARRNRARHRAGNVRLCAADWLAPFRAGCFDVVVSNPPYVAGGDPHLARGDAAHEPRRALAAGADGLVHLNAIIAQCAGRIAPGGRLLLEHGFTQGPAVRAAMRGHGFTEVRTWPDLQGHERITAARAP